MRRSPAAARLGVLAVALLLAAPLPAAAAETSLPAAYEALLGLAAESRKLRREAARAIEDGRRGLIPGLVDYLFFVPLERRRELLGVLERLAGERRESYYEWVEWVGAHGEIEPAEGYPIWKLFLLQRIDPDYGRVLYPGAPARIRLEEVVSGGVRVAGIPALDRPPTVAADEARYLKDDEKVFGVALGGEARAYPVRFLSWNELLNDEIGGEPISLSFCTLCGSGILYSTRTADGGAYTFDTSGLLYRSNKLMVDRQTWTLWSNLTGRPVLGRLASSDLALEMLPSTLTTWGEWRRRHPATRVLDLEALRRDGARLGFDYRPGAADRARTGVRFPVWQKSDALPRQAEIFALRLGGEAKAWALEPLLEAGVVNDTVGGEALVLVADAASGAVRAYRRGGRSFEPGARPDELVDGGGLRWRVEEGRLAPAEEDDPGAGLERLPGHVAFWFGWYAFYPDTSLWTGAGST